MASVTRTMSFYNTQTRFSAFVFVDSWPFRPLAFLTFQLHKWHFSVTLTPCLWGVITHGCLSSSILHRSQGPKDKKNVFLSLKKLQLSSARLYHVFLCIEIVCIKKMFIYLMRNANFEIQYVISNSICKPSDGWWSIASHPFRFIQLWSILMERVTYLWSSC